MSVILLAILKQLAPMIISPIATWFAKWATEKMKGAISPKYAPAVSVVFGTIAAGLTGDVSSVPALAETVVAGVTGGLAGSKARDMFVGKTRSITPEDFNVFGEK